MSGVERIRVLIVSPCFGEYGGIEAFVFAVAEMAESDPRLDVRICFKRVENFVMGAPLARICAGRRVAFCDRASAELWGQIGWADVVHAQNASPDVAVMCALRRKPLAFTIHDFLPHTPWLRRLSWQVSARVASARWFNSAAVWRTWEPGSGRAGSARVPTVSRVSDAHVDPAARAGFVFVGRLVDSKGIETLIDAYAASELEGERWPLTIVGDGPLRGELARRAAGKGRGRIRFTGFVDDDAKASAVASARWLVAPSHAHEGLGLVVFEARRAGVPCIIARHGGLPEAGGRDALVCEPSDVPSLTAALRTAAAMTDDDYAGRAQRTKADLARELVPLSFYADAYRRLVSGRAPAEPAYQSGASS